MKSMIKTALVLIPLLPIIFINACSADGKHIAKTAIDITNATCVILRGAGAGSAIEEGCFLEEELAPIVKHLIARRKLKEKVSAPSPSDSASAVVVPVDACEVK